MRVPDINLLLYAYDAASLPKDDTLVGD